jgi:sugar transferase (PEP-CTERM system associated)
MFKVFAHRIKTLTVVEFFADTVVCFLAIFVAANQLITNRAEHGSTFVEPSILMPAIGFALVMSLMYTFVGLYRRGAIFVGLGALLRRALLAVCMGTCVAFFALKLDGQSHYAVPLLARVVAYMTIGVVAVRSFGFVARQSSVGARRMLIVGTGPEAQAVAKDIKIHGDSHNIIVGFYAAGSEQVSGDLNQIKVFPSNQLISQIAKEHRVDEVLVAIKEQRGGAVPMDQLLACRIQGIRVLDLAGFYERAHGEVPIDSLKASWLVYGNGFTQGLVRTSVKRIFDVVCSSLLLLLALPVMLCAIAAIRLESPGPIIYRQTRVGLRGKLFTCLKFRSMRADAEKDGVARWATKNDARITRVGQFMRKTRIDELPQLISVLRGEMSLVGPRPERPSFVDQLKEEIPYYDIRHSVKPGVTGWAQVRYGYGATVSDARKKHQFDLYYVKNNSLCLDLLVLVETVSVVLFREGSQ